MGSRAGVGHWSLVIHWSYWFGHWSFLSSLFAHDPEPHERPVAEPPAALGVLRIRGVPVGVLLFAGAAVDVLGFAVVAAAHRGGLGLGVFARDGHELHDVAEHVVQAPVVRRLLADRVGLVVGVVPVPGDFAETAAGRHRARAGAAGVFPLRIRRQSILLAGL